MAQADFGTGKSLVVLAIVVGCFAVLWPKIFYPMMQTAFAMTSPKIDSETFKETDRPPHLHPGSMNPRVRNSVPDDVQDKFHMREGRPFPHPQARQPVKAQPKSGGAMSIIMPIYTVGIIVFFLYTVLKLVFKKPSESEKKPLIKDFHMDPEYQKFVCEQPKEGANKNRQNKCFKKHSKPFEGSIPEEPVQDLDAKDYEIFKLKKKLEETEQAMQRIMEHMGAMSQCLSEKLPTENEKSDVRLRHKGNSEKQKNSHSWENGNDNESVNHEGCKKLQEDLTKLMSMANVHDSSTMAGEKNHSNKISECSDDNASEIMYTGSEEESSDVEVNSHNEEKEEQGLFGKKPCGPNGCCNNVACDKMQ